jgi:hypothetical protein
MVVCAVNVERVSARISLDNREKYREMSLLAALALSDVRNKRGFQWVRAEFPIEPNREFDTG